MFAIRKSNARQVHDPVAPIDMPADDRGAEQGRSADGESMSTLQRFNVVRSKIENEDALMGVRLGWLIASESFLVAAYAAALTVSTSPGTDRFLSAAKRLTDVLPILGVLLAGLVLVSIAAGISAINSLRDMCCRDPWKMPKNWPDVVSNDRIHRLGLIAPIGVPVALVGVWVYIVASRIADG